MRIDVELTEEERDALLWLMGAGTSGAVQHDMPNVAKAGIRVLNKMFADSPEYTPYDEASFDETNPKFPFRRVEPQ
jgi:hypothetical protein